MKGLFIQLIAVLIILPLTSLFAQYSEPVSLIPFVSEPDISPQCANGIKYDDNTFEGNIGLTAPDKWIVQKIRPSVYPFRINQVCFALTRGTTNPPNWPFDIVVFDTTGAGGAPGNLVATISNQTAVNVPVYPTITWFDFNNITGIPDITSGSYYIGMYWTSSNYPGGFLGIDQNPNAPAWYVYFKTSGPWTPLTIYNPNGKAVSIRADGFRPALAHDFAAGPFLSLPDEYAPGSTYSIKARISNLGSSDETGVLIKFFVDGVMNDFVGISLDSGASDSVSFQWSALEGYHSLKIASALNNDQYRNNDTVSIVILGGAANGGGFETCRSRLHIKTVDNASVYDSVYVEIPPWAFGVLDINVKIDSLIHHWDSDLIFTLKHGAESVDFISHVGGNGNNFFGTILNDSAEVKIENGMPPFTGTFIPSNPLSVFNGAFSNPDGYWILKITDTQMGETGYLQSWCLSVSYFSYIGGIGTVTVPNYYLLKQNYPNPFNPSTNIEYAIPKAGDVEIIVFDILGREIEVLVNEYKKPGIYKAEFNADAISSGVYFYRMRSGSFSDTKKMLIIK
jgi:hypothetical protein